MANNINKTENMSVNDKNIAMMAWSDHCEACYFEYETTLIRAGRKDELKPTKKSVDILSRFLDAKDQAGIDRLMAMSPDEIKAEYDAIQKERYG